MKFEIEIIPLKKRNYSLVDDVLKRWPISLIGTSGGTFPKESTMIGPAVLIPGNSSMSSMNFSCAVTPQLYLPSDSFVHAKALFWCGNRAIDACGPLELRNM